ncbi:hypothetical protein PCC8801_4282 [Rippkaea orientalis PCC 8801]|uniref:Uncharacterized protein n=1 Tax=Rippkaea orientalis (strain PCC 8801 / RF-1) TaxID=41431 RepID=B7JV72_RIPO1|nr:hypothetical protein [Rippkaea orientalis]ACK68205.1 hypothetical protein PCC8801_4282 [Rippkaea orientalis PCC 8801]
MFLENTQEKNLQEKSLAVQFVDQQLDIDEFLNEFVKASIKNIETHLERDVEEITIEHKKEILISKMSEILRKQLVRESIKNFTEQEIAYLNDKFAQFQLKFFKETEHNTTRFSQLFDKIHTLDIQLEKFSRKTDSFNIRLDQFENQVNLIEKNIGLFATKNYISDTLNKQIEDQTNLLTKQLISQEQLETLIEKIEQTKIDLETKIKEVAQDDDLVNQVNELKSQLSAKPTTKDFIIGIGVTIGLTIIGVLVSTSWMFNQKINTLESQITPKMGNLEKTVNNNH